MSNGSKIERSVRTNKLLDSFVNSKSQEDDSIQLNPEDRKIN